jgi:mannitol-specific phosphotransferase system IIBC component
MKKLLIFGIIFLSFFQSSYAQYQLTEKDNLILDKIESKIEKLVNNGSLNPADFVKKIDTILDTKKLTPRVETLLITLANDIEYIYQIYSEETFTMSEDECYE